MNHQWTENRISLVGAQDTKFPTHEVLHWQELRTVPERVRELIRATNETMTQIENDPNLSAEGIQHKRADFAREVLAQLDKLMEPAESAAGRRIEKLREKMDAVVTKGKPKDVAEAQIAAEIRAHIAKQESPVMAALRLKGDAKAISAVLDAPPFLSGLNEQEAATLRAEALASTEQQHEVNEITNALAVCKGAIKGAASMICERAKVRQRHDGTWEEFR
jgi:hypothetical protein